MISCNGTFRELYLSLAFTVGSVGICMMLLILDLHAFLIYLVLLSGALEPI